MGLLRKPLVILSVVVAILAAGAGIARAVQWGTPDASNQYAGVGLVVFYDSANHPLWRCTGALVSPTVLLTAGHCTGIDPGLGFAPSRAQVWFSNGYPTPIPRGNLPVGTSDCTGFTGYPCSGDVGGTPHAHPGWNGYLTLPNTHDMGVVVLDQAVSQPTYSIASVGALDSLKSKRGQQDVNFTVVGYGLQLEKPVAIGVRTRYYGDVQLHNLTNALAGGYNLLTSDSPGNGTGGSGTCFGDSGGPVFYDGQIAAVTSFGFNGNCRGSSGAFRMDTQLAHDFLAQYVS